MNFKIIVTVLTAIILITFPCFGSREKRPAELRFYVNRHLSTVTAIDYNSKGDVIKMSSYENSKLTDYAKYKYDPDGRLSLEKTYDASNILLRTRMYFYNESGKLTGEKVYSSSGSLIEYLVLSWNGKRIEKVEYYKPDDNIYQTIDYNYKGDVLTIVIFNKIGKYIMIMKAIYNENMLLTGHSIKHSNADIKIETEYIYEDGYVTDQALLLIFK